LKEWIIPDFRNTPSTTNLEEEEIVDAPGKDGNASIPEQIKRPNPWRRKKKMMMMKPPFPLFKYNHLFCYLFCCPLDSTDRAGSIRCQTTHCIANLFVIYLFIYI
jgi:hypothetical protein